MLKIKGIEKLSENQHFFVENFFDATEKLYKKETEVFKFALELQEKNAKEIFDMISKVMLNYDIDNTCMKLAPKDIRKLKKEFFKKIDSAFADEYRRENSTLTKTLLEVGESKYNYSAYLLGLGVNFNIKKISDTKLNKILKNTIQGETYSNRIYKNKDKIAKELKKEIKRFLNGETNCNNISKILNKKFKINKDNSSRLISDQVARVQDEINEQFFKDNPEFEDLLYCATLDNHTCSDCAELDGRTYKKSDDSRPSLPKHVRCRCTYILIPSEDYRPKRRINNINNETIDYKTFNEWKEDN